MKILITNVWPANRGDEAQTDIFIENIKRFRPNADITCLLANKTNLNLTSSIKTLPFVTAELLGKHADLKDDLYRNMCERIGLQKEFDLIIEAPHGPDIGDLHKPRLNYGVSAGKFAKQLNAPIHFSSSSFGPFLIDEPFRREVLEYASSIVAREPISYSYLIDYVPDLKNKIYSAIDWVFAGEQDGNETFESENFKREKDILQAGEFVGATINSMPICRFAKKWFQKKIIRQNPSPMEEFAGFFDKVIEKTGKRLALFPHVYNYDWNNLKKVVERMQHGNKVHLIDIELNWAEIVRIMKYLEFFISFRYHPTIFAIKAGIPFICVMNQHKAEGMTKMLGLQEYSIYKDEGFGKIYKLFCKGWDRKEEIIELISKTDKVVKEKVALNRQVLSAFLS